MGEGNVAQRSWDGDGRRMMLPGEPHLAYQPVVDLASGRLLGFEALLRWDHPTEGLILPKLLVPWAEANGDIVALGEWVLVEACRQASTWRSSVQVAVNCSIVQLRRKMAARAVRRALSDSGLDPDRLTIEVTEHAMADEEAVGELHAIAELGVQLSVDDVGTSWSSFDVLRRLAVNTVKIDESFVMGLEAREGINRMVVETVVHLAHSAGMSTIAEGVESALQASIVRRFDSDAAQGYHFSPPLGDEEATALANDPELRFPLEAPESTDIPRGRHVAGRRVAPSPAGAIGAMDAGSPEPGPSPDPAVPGPTPSPDPAVPGPTPSPDPAVPGRPRLGLV
ncbi:MAG: EAL domain-containing protein, partial [Acidimicrobiales bacterium]